MELISVTEAARRLGLSPQRVRQFVESGRLRARKVGAQWVIRAADLRRFANKPRRPGRPVSKN